MVKIYLKRGNLNYKERRLVAEISQAIEQKIQVDPTFEQKFVPAATFEELQKMHASYCSDVVEFEEIKNEKTGDTGDSKTSESESKNNVETTQTSDENQQTNEVIEDPFNEQEPVVRDYVMLDEGKAANTNENPNHQTAFSEPTNFAESFAMPDDKENGSIGDNYSQQSKENSETTSKQTSSESKDKKSTSNTGFDELTDAKKKRSTRRFAKYIVEAVCMLCEKGFVWYANKDINEAKLAEYELTGEIDLSILLTLEHNQEATVKDWFLGMGSKAEELSKFDPKEKEDLADALAEVLLEKGIGPTPMQELGMIAFKIFGEKGLNLLALKAQTSSVITQLKAMKKEEVEETQEASVVQDNTSNSASNESSSNSNEEVNALVETVKQ